MHIRHVCAGVAGWAFATVTLTLPAQWSQLSPRTRPPASAPGDLMDYDLARDRVVLHVGRQTWEFDGADWEKRADGSGPATGAGCMAYDGKRRRIVVLDEASTTWEWDGTQWTRMQPAHRPPARASASFAYDERHERCLLFGGTSGTVYYRDTWEWDGTSWVERKPAQAPLFSIGGGMAFDVARQRLVLYSGFLASDHWEWDGQDWTLRLPASRPLGVGFPMAYDRCRRQLVLFEPPPWNTSQLWAFDGADWSRVPAAPIRTATAPGFAYDAARQRLILFGGKVTPTQYYDDTWQFASTPCAAGSVFPAQYVATEGDAALSFPFTLPRCRVQFVMAAAGFSGRRTGNVQSLAFRRDRGTLEQSSRFVECEILLAPAAHAPARMSTRFEENLTSQQTLVHRGVLALPRNPPTAPGAAPFSILIPCAQAFAWGGADLLIDIQLTNNTAPGIGTYEIDAVSRARATGQISYFGASCRGQRGEPLLQAYLPELLHAGGLLVSQIHGASPGGYAVSFLGTSTSDWAGLPLPFTWPGTSCSLLTGAELIETTLTDPSGTASTLWPLPPDPVLDGAVRYHQWAVLEPSQAYPPFAMSRAAKLTFVRPSTDADTLVSPDPHGLLGVKDPRAHVAPVLRLVVQ